MNTIDKKQVEDWLKTKDIIMKFLREICLPHNNVEFYEHNAECLIARLAQENFLIVDASDLPDEE